MFRLYQQTHEPSGEGTPRAAASGFRAGAAVRNRRAVAPHEREEALRRTCNDDAALREEADQLFLWLSETLGDPRADGLEFVAGIERLAELLVQLRREGGVLGERDPNIPFMG